MEITLKTKRTKTGGAVKGRRAGVPLQARIDPELAERLEARVARTGRTKSAEVQTLIDRGMMISELMGDKDQAGFSLVSEWATNGVRGVLRVLDENTLWGTLSSEILALFLKHGVRPVFEGDKP